MAPLQKNGSKIIEKNTLTSLVVTNIQNVHDSATKGSEVLNSMFKVLSMVAELPRALARGSMVNALPPSRVLTPSRLTG